MAEIPLPKRLYVPVISLLCLVCHAVDVGVFGAAQIVENFAGTALDRDRLVDAWTPPRAFALSHPLAKPYVVPEGIAADVFRQLHTQTYESFRFRNEEQIYDALATSVQGDLLQEIYLEIQRGLKMEEQGGAVSRIRDVEIIDGVFEPLAGENIPTGNIHLSGPLERRWNG